MPRKSYWFEAALVPTLCVAFAILFLTDKPLYRSLTDEDSWIQNLTAVFLLTAGVMAMTTAWRGETTALPHILLRSRNGSRSGGA